MDLTPFDDPVAEELVRTTDPATSHAAAESIVATATEIQARVYGLLSRHGPMTDEELLHVYQDEYGITAESSPRKRRCDLMHAGWVRDTGQRRELRSGRSGIVWAVIVKGQNDASV